MMCNLDILKHIFTHMADMPSYIREAKEKGAKIVGFFRFFSWKLCAGGNNLRLRSNSSLS